jgi:hypothetical protein
MKTIVLVSTLIALAAPSQAAQKDNARHVSGEDQC